ncbi:rabenosyn-5 isoform X2 [Bacillus rossius redtenbacheri]|uniref:rabenosyn-5 isoform X2 n=1 Tax=Bacillus rossius redtenbacheri TaxID=93214 RepID=UPI002FDD7A7D
MAESGEILEGYICPVCKVDLGSPIKLHDHFQVEHTEDQDVLRSLKGLLGRAKKRILKLDEEPISDSEYRVHSGSSGVSVNYQPLAVEPQTIGVTRSHTQQFCKIRSQHVVRYAAETNKLLIRLEKLLSDLPTDAVKRKAHEQAVVPWLDDRDVRLCPSCARAFHLARRKHHCRLCGAVMCHDCTHFLQVNAARKMTSSAASAGETPAAATGVANHGSPVAGLLRRSNSNSSLNSMLSLVDTVTGEQHFRLCVHCKQLLDAREQQNASRSMKPILSQFYDRLHSYMAEADHLAVQYLKMCESLNSGESTYSLDEAQMLRVKIFKLAESIDSLSNKIAVLGTKDVDNPPRGKALKLQQIIRSAATMYLKEQLITLPVLPTESQLAALRDRRRREVTSRILQEKQQMAAEMQRRRESQSPCRSSASPQRSAQNPVVMDAGWGPETAQMFDSDDPMVQQMNIIRNYIKQARLAHRDDEVSTLEQNLRELQDEYHRQQAEILGT